MSDTHASTEDQYESGLSEIRIQGHLDDRWSDWFGGLTITLEDNGDTLLTGPVIDQARCMACSKKCVIWVCHWSQSVLLNPDRWISQTSNRKWI